jgi:hypothetical protein
MAATSHRTRDNGPSRRPAADHCCVAPRARLRCYLEAEHVPPLRGSDSLKTACRLDLCRSRAIRAGARSCRGWPRATLPPSRERPRELARGHKANGVTLAPAPRRRAAFPGWSGVCSPASARCAPRSCRSRSGREWPSGALLRASGLPRRPVDKIVRALTVRLRSHVEGTRRRTPKVAGRAGDVVSSRSKLCQSCDSVAFAPSGFTRAQPAQASPYEGPSR